VSSRASQFTALFAILLSSGASTAFAADHTTLNVLVASNMKPAFLQIAAAYEKTHPDVSVQGTFVSSTVIDTEVEQGAAADAIVISRLVIEPKITAAVDGFTPVYQTHSVLAIAKGAASKIASVKDLAKPGVRIAMGIPGSAVSAWQIPLQAKLAAAYGKDWGDHFQANIQLRKTDILHLLEAVDSGAADAVFVFSSDVDPAKMVRVDLPPAMQATVPFVMATVKASPHAAATHDFVEYCTTAPAKAILQAHGFDAR